MHTDEDVLKAEVQRWKGRARAHFTITQAAGDLINDDETERLDDTRFVVSQDRIHALRRAVQVYMNQLLEQRQ